MLLDFHLADEAQFTRAAMIDSGSKPMKQRKGFPPIA